MHAGAIRKLLYVFFASAGDDPLAKACGLSSCIDAQTYHDFGAFLLIYVVH